jgi:hypothetical protein
LAASPPTLTDTYTRSETFPTAASRTLEPNQALILLAARPTGAQWLCPPL